MKNIMISFFILFSQPTKMSIFFNLLLPYFFSPTPPVFPYPPLLPLPSFHTSVSLPSQTSSSSTSASPHCASQHFPSLKYLSNPSLFLTYFHTHMHYHFSPPFSSLTTLLHFQQFALLFLTSSTLISFQFTYFTSPNFPSLSLMHIPSLALTTVSHFPSLLYFLSPSYLLTIMYHFPFPYFT